MAGENSSKRNNSKKNSASKAPSTIASPINGTKAPTRSKGKKIATNDASPPSNIIPQGRLPLPPSSSTTQIRQQDGLMPIANVIRVMRRILPSHAKISEEAKDTVQECVSEFISFITEEANEKCRRDHRKTITADDLISSMSTLGFDNYVDPLLTYLHKYRQSDAVARGRVTQMPMRSQTIASPVVVARPSIMVGPNPATMTPISAVAATTTPNMAASVTATGSYIGDHSNHGFGLINNASYDQCIVGSSSSNHDNWLEFGDDFDLLTPMVSPRPNASNTDVYQDQGETYDPFSRLNK